MLTSGSCSICLTDVVKVLLIAHTPALMEPRFELPGCDNAAEHVVLAPIKGQHTVEIAGPWSVDTRYSVEQSYNAMISKMMGDLQAARVDWCRDELWPESVSPAAGATVPSLT